MKQAFVFCCVSAAMLIAACTRPEVDVKVEANEHGHEHEMEGVAYNNSAKVLPPDVPLSESVRVDEELYLSGLVGIKPGTMDLVEGGLVPEARQTMENIKKILEASGYTMDDIVKVTVFLADIREWAAFNEVYRTYFTKHYPARSALGANGLALGARVEVECVAVKADSEDEDDQ